MLLGFVLAVGGAGAGEFQPIGEWEGEMIIDEEKFNLAMDDLPEEDQLDNYEALQEMRERKATLKFSADGTYESFQPHMVKPELGTYEIVSTANNDVTVKLTRKIGTHYFTRLLFSDADTFDFAPSRPAERAGQEELGLSLIFRRVR